MIRMEQPSYCFNSCDVGEPHYKMWKTTVGREGMRPFELASQIVAINQTAIVTTGFKLQNIIINTHGAPGALRIGGFNVGATYKEDLGAFAFLKPFNVGTIWLVSCDAARDTTR